MDLPVAWVYTHDSVALGEDGPTHQPVEHIMALRAIPGLAVMRPGDAAETAEAWRVTLEELDGPVAFALSRQNLPVLERGGSSGLASAEGVARGAYVLAEGSDACIIATGGELPTALAARELLDREDDLSVRVVSMPCWELFEQQDEEYQDEVLLDVPTVSVEAGISLGWERWGVDDMVALDRFGASAPGTEVLEHFGFTPEHVAQVVREVLDEEE
jgi:transketolase